MVWALKLQAYYFDLVHRKCKYNQAPDALPRAIADVHVLTNVSYVGNARYYRLGDLITSYPDRYPASKIEDGRILKTQEN